MISPKFKAILLPVLVLLIVVFASLFFLRPKVSEIFKLRDSLAKNKESLARLTQKLASLEGLSQTELTAKTKTVTKVLPIEKDVPLILATLKTLATQTGVDLVEIKAEPGELSTDSDRLSFLAFELGFGGERNKLKDLLKEIEQVVPLMRIEEVVFFQSESLVEMSLNLNALFLPLPEKLASIETPVALLVPQEEKTYQELVEFKSVSVSTGLPLVPSGKENPFAF